MMNVYYNKAREGFDPAVYVAFAALIAATALFCVCAGSVSVSPREALALVFGGAGVEAVKDSTRSIIMLVRLPRVICAALSGASLSVCGAAMQGLLRNPLADGSTLGVSSGAALGAVTAIAFGIAVPGFAPGGTMLLSISFAFVSLLIILSLAYRLDSSLSTSTIILIGVIFSMFVSSIMSLVVSFAGERAKTIMFWTMGSLSGAGYIEAAAMASSLLLGAPVLLGLSRELNAFAIGEDNARSVGIDVRRVKLAVMIAASVMIGVCVAIGGTIGFVGLSVPHMARFITGPNHKRLLPASICFGAVFLMLTDLMSRTLLSPVELPIGVVTSLIGSVIFVVIFYRTRVRP